ncbi:unnamed protein product [Schistosoma margrebowiei]|uniref:Uncharacterized protein n=1 Tax=Schistosoma margrebowiei TaxID=48269 RepID=A0AA85AF43_9TREM|nr:unnamed protein product [Schistosoma margrebowiei]
MRYSSVIYMIIIFSIIHPSIQDLYDWIKLQTLEFHRDQAKRQFNYAILQMDKSIDEMNYVKYQLIEDYPTEFESLTKYVSCTLKRMKSESLVKLTKKINLMESSVLKTCLDIDESFHQRVIFQSEYVRIRRSIEKVNTNLYLFNYYLIEYKFLSEIVNEFKIQIKEGK